MTLKKNVITILLILVVCITYGMGTGLHDAARKCDAENVKLVLKDDPKSLEEKDAQGGTPLLTASVRGCKDVAELLIANGADVNAANRMGFTPLFMAASMGHLEIVRDLIKNGADVNHMSLAGTPLHRAAFKGDRELVEILTANGATVNAKDRKGMTPLHYTTVRGNIDAARLLLEKGALVDEKDTAGRTPLLWTIFNGAENVAPMVKLFIEKGADVNTVGGEGETPLKSAVDNGYTGVVELLLKKGADSRSKENGDGKTLLHLASVNGYRDIVEILLAGGLPVNAADSTGCTALDCARRYGHHTIADLLAAKGGIARSPRLNGAKPGARETSAWYLNHRGWAVETKDHVLIFDSEDHGRKPDQPSLFNGHLTREALAGQNVFALYTTYHGVTGEPGEGIHQLEKETGGITLIHNKQDPWRWGEKTVYMGPGEKKSLDTLEILSIPMSASQGYLVRVDGRVIFYSGFPGGDPGEWEAFKKSIDTSKTFSGTCDLAFVQVTGPGTTNEWAYHIIETLKPAAVCLMEPGRRPHYLRAFARELAAKKIKTKVYCPEYPGDHFLY